VFTYLGCIENRRNEDRIYVLFLCVMCRGSLMVEYRSVRLL